MTRGARRAAAAVTLGLAVLVGLATPAGAHSTSGPPASNFHTEVTGVRPAGAAVTVGLGPDGERVELTTHAGVRVTVLGYRGEPYLRVSRTGVFENRSSPAVALNRSRIPSGPAPDGRIRRPRWVRVSDGPTARWHDHRAHWMGGSTPAVVRADPDHGHVVGRWRIPLRIDGAAAAITGTQRWSPPPAAGLWWGVAAVLALAVLAGIAVAARPVFLLALGLLTVAETLHLWGAWPISTASTLGRLGENVPSIAAVVVSVLAAAWSARRGVDSAAPLLILAGLFAAVAGGFADLPSLSHSWVPSRLDPDVARLLVAVSLGVGTGVAIGGAWRLWSTRAPRPTT
jgi:hypothetical protein